MPIAHTLALGSELDYAIQWSDWLAELPTGQEIDTSVWSIISGGDEITISNDFISGTKTYTYVNAKLATTPVELVLKNEVVSTNLSGPDYTDSRYITILVQARVYAEPS